MDVLETVNRKAQLTAARWVTKNIHESEQHDVLTGILEHLGFLSNEDGDWYYAPYGKRKHRSNDDGTFTLCHIKIADNWNNGENGSKSRCRQCVRAYEKLVIQ